MGRKTQIPAAAFAAVRDGDIRPAEAARQAGVTRQAFDQSFRTFRVQQMRQRTKRALLACANWLAFCLSIGWSRADLDELERIWWQWHDENGNLLTSNRRA